MTGKKISEASLGQLEHLGSGGFAEVFAVPDFTLPGDNTPLAYKRFTIEHAHQTRSAQAAVNFRASLGPADRADLDERTTWPRALVNDSAGSVSGLLMPLIPPQFFFQAPDHLGQMARKPREMSWLVSSAEQRNAAQVDFGEIPRTDRLVMLAQLTYVVGRLHKHGWVFGDLSFSNTVFALDPPRILLLDCDGAAALTDHSRKQSSTPFWDPPECPIEEPPGGRKQERQDDLTDVYKLGLAILRCLTPGKGASSSRNVKRLGAELDAAGTNLVARSLSEYRNIRPRAKEIYAYLRHTAASRITVPQVTQAWLMTPTRVRGLEARIAWQIDEANDVVVRFGSGQTVTVSLADHPRGYTLPQHSGSVSIEARNRFGTTRVELGELILYDLPEFKVNLVGLPALHVPEIKPFCPQSLEVTTAGRPRSPVGIEVPPLPALDTAGLVDALSPATKAPVLPPIGEAVGAASEGVTSMILDARGAFDQILREKFMEHNEAS